MKDYTIVSCDSDGENFVDWITAPTPTLACVDIHVLRRNVHIIAVFNGHHKDGLTVYPGTPAAFGKTATGSMPPETEGVVSNRVE